MFVVVIEFCCMVWYETYYGNWIIYHIPLKLFPYRKDWDDFT